MRNAPRAREAALAGSLVLLVACSAERPPVAPRAEPAGRGRSAASAASTASASVPPLLAGSTSIPLFLLPVTDDLTVPPGHVRLVLDRDRTSFGEVSARGVATVEGRQVDVPLGAYPESHERVVAAHRACTFLVDCDEPDVREVLDGARDVLGRTPSADAAAAWVSRFIVTKTSTRLFDVASEVVHGRRGDCSEHAVLLAALLRHVGLPARVVTGLVLFGLPGRSLTAAGHAWVEVHKGGRWRPVDAAIRVDELVHAGGPVVVHYVPIHVISREDPGFGVGMAEADGPAEVAAVHLPATVSTPPDPGAR